MFTAFAIDHRIVCRMCERIRHHFIDMIAPGTYQVTCINCEETRETVLEGGRLVEPEAAEVQSKFRFRDASKRNEVPEYARYVRSSRPGGRSAGERRGGSRVGAGRRESVLRTRENAAGSLPAPSRLPGGLTVPQSSRAGATGSVWIVSSSGSIALEQLNPWPQAAVAASCSSAMAPTMEVPA